MHLVYIADVIIAAIIILKIIHGWRRGFIRTISGLIALLCAVFGSLWLKDLLSPALSATLFLPKVQQFVTERVDTGSDILSEQLDSFMQSVNLPEGIEGKLGEGILEQVSQGGSELINAAAETLSMKLTEIIVFLVCFIIIYFVVRALIRLLDGTVFKVPGLKQLNKFLGALMGLLSGAFIAGLVLAVVFLFFPALSEAGAVLSAESLSESFIAHFYFDLFPGVFS
ncbi:MAG: CvpA family protein [Oscillospiraceae bacterium]|nr:CvpA family protein [Oscillospiraceae bacterium]